MTGCILFLQAYVPELFILEGSYDDNTSILGPLSDRSSQNSSDTMHSGRFSDKSHFGPHKTIPPIQNGGFISGRQTGKHIIIQNRIYAKEDKPVNTFTE